MLCWIKQCNQHTPSHACLNNKLLRYKTSRFGIEWKGLIKGGTDFQRAGKHEMNAKSIKDMFPCQYPSLSKLSCPFSIHCKQESIWGD